MNQPDLCRLVTVTHRGVGLWLSAVLLWVGSAPEAAAGTAGRLDLSFNGTGTVLTELSGLGLCDRATDVALQSDGKIVVAGSTGADCTFPTFFALVRYNPDGTPDSSFGTSGRVFTEFGGVRARGNALAIQSDGKIVVAGSGRSSSAGDDEFALARYNPDGTLDSSFGIGGKVLTDLGVGIDGALALAIQTDGKIVVAGHTFGGDVLVRYNSDGTLDGSFGTGGTIDVIAGRRVALQSDGKIVVAGTRFRTTRDFGLARYNPDGTLDSSFGTGGTVATDVSGVDDNVYALAISSDGKIVVAGSSGDDPSGGFEDFALARYNSDGTLDGSFGTGGTVVTDFGGAIVEVAVAVAIQSDGKIVVAGPTPAGFLPLFLGDFLLARYKTDGTLDSCTLAGDVLAFSHCFGTASSGGTVVTDFGGTEFAAALALQSDGKIVVAGSSNANGSFDFALARYLPDTTTVFAPPTSLVQSFDLPEGLETSLMVKLDDAVTAVNAGDTATACADLADFINEVEAQAGKKKLTVSRADQLIATAQQTQAELGCPANSE